MAFSSVNLNQIAGCTFVGMFFARYHHMKYASITFFSLFLILCTSASAQNTITLEKKYLVSARDSTVLTINMAPVITCYSYRKGEAPKPCIVFNEVNCEVSRPVNTTVTVELSKPGTAGTIQVSIAPNTTRATYRSSPVNVSSQNSADLFKVTNVVARDMVVSTIH